MRLVTALGSRTAVLRRTRVERMSELASLCAATVLLTFAASGVQKFVEREAMRTALREWPLLGARAGIATAGLTAAELAVPLLAAVGELTLALVWAAMLLAVFTARSVFVTRHGQAAVRCLCFSVSSSPPAGLRAALRSTALFAVALFALAKVTPPGRPGMVGGAVVVGLLLLEDAHHFMTHNAAHLRSLRGAS